MLRPTKVVPITKDKPPGKARLIASDERTQRLIIGIGSERMAVDVVTRFTNLPPHTGDQPATVLPMKRNPRSSKKSRKESA